MAPRTSFSDTTAAAGTVVHYRIAAVDAAGTSAYSTAAQALTLPGQPVVLATVASATQINIRWVPVTGAANYLLQDSSDGGNTWNTLATQAGTTYAHTALSADTTYRYQVTAIDASGDSLPSTPVSGTTTLAAPAAFTATPVSATAVALSWTAVQDATTYKLERSPDHTTWTALTPSQALTSSSVSYTDTTVSAGNTYSYRISSINAGGSSVASTVVNATTLPLTPTLTATVASATEVDLHWAASNGATSYKVESSNDGGNTWSTLATQAGTSYANTALTADHGYEYRISAIDATGTSPSSATVTLTTLLNAPTNFTAASNGPTEIDLTWTPVADATAYKLERSIGNNTTWTTLSPNPALTLGSSSYADTGVPAGTSCYYRLSAISAAGTSVASSTVTALTIPSSPVLSASVISSSEVDLSWASVAGATSYRVEVSADGGTTWTTAASPTAALFNDTALSADTAYKFRVSATDATGTSAPSSTVSKSTIVTAPTALSATTVSSTVIGLSWTPVTDATTYKIQRSTDQHAWSTLTTALTGTSASYQDTTAVAATTYYYNISAVNAAGTSVASANVHALTFSTAPTVTPTVVSASEIDLAWTTPVTATSYRVLASSDGGVTWNLLATQAGTTYKNTALSADTQYRYEVVAINAAGNSAPSSPVSGTTLLLPPSNFALGSSSSTSMTLSWTAVADATSYKIERSADGTVWTAAAPAPH